MKRPNMEEIEYYFRIFERPSVDQSREMADYIYELEDRLSTIAQHPLSGSPEGSPKLKNDDEIDKNIISPPNKMVKEEWYF